jgi:hypothetical protein
LCKLTDFLETFYTHHAILVCHVFIYHCGEDSATLEASRTSELPSLNMWLSSLSWDNFEKCPPH